MIRPQKSRYSALLMEIVLVTLFFLLSATVILNLFVAVHDLSRQARLLEEASAQAQNCAERLYAAQFEEEALFALGFKASDQGLSRTDENDLTVLVSVTREITGAGRLHRALVRVCAGDKELVSLPVARYIPDGGEVPE